MGHPAGAFNSRSRSKVKGSGQECALHTCSGGESGFLTGAWGPVRNAKELNGDLPCLSGARLQKTCSTGHSFVGVGLRRCARPDRGRRGREKAFHGKLAEAAAQQLGDIEKNQNPNMRRTKPTPRKGLRAVVSHFSQRTQEMGHPAGASIQDQAARSKAADRSVRSTRERGISDSTFVAELGLRYGSVETEILRYAWKAASLRMTTP